ncbi:hypothetical protein NM688_g3838 [Phlebia brevispora]|uniref:Uncharacterized protein n=1 Tax=Phlebia brevispora TaxID=194682 RepID=A0ACC1T4Q2_9APHY|nr:hypothetical protein NM688_g3838 [Phlebia brevispora]
MRRCAISTCLPCPLLDGAVADFSGRAQSCSPVFRVVKRPRVYLNFLGYDITQEPCRPHHPRAQSNEAQRAYDDSHAKTMLSFYSSWVQVMVADERQDTEHIHSFYYKSLGLHGDADGHGGDILSPSCTRVSRHLIWPSHSGPRVPTYPQGASLTQGAWFQMGCTKLEELSLEDWLPLRYSPAEFTIFLPAPFTEPSSSGKRLRATALDDKTHRTPSAFDEVSGDIGSPWARHRTFGMFLRRQRISHDAAPRTATYDTPGLRYGSFQTSSDAYRPDLNPLRGQR